MKRLPEQTCNQVCFYCSKLPLHMQSRFSGPFKRLPEFIDTALPGIY